MIREEFSDLKLASELVSVNNELLEEKSEASEKELLLEQMISEKSDISQS